MSIAFLLGFVLDNLTLTRIDQLFDNMVLLSYLFMTGLSIMLYHMYDSGRLQFWPFKKICPWLPVYIQFTFGGLFSGYLVFYSRSATLAGSWPFVLMLVLLVVSNELFKSKMARFGLQISLYFMTLFSFMIFFIPVLIGEMGATIFLLSGAVSLLCIRLYILLLEKVVPRKVIQIKRVLFPSILAIFLSFNALYFTNLIPPIPLSLKDAEIFHYVERQSDGTYVALAETREWYEVQKYFKTEFHTVAGEPIYFFSAIFAPTKLNAQVFHHWQYYNETTQAWVSADKFGFAIAGGRGEGYRGYTTKNSTHFGKWRVDIETDRGQLIGRTVFYVVQSTQPPETETVIK